MAAPLLIPTIAAGLYIKSKDYNWKGQHLPTRRLMMQLWKDKSKAPGPQWAKLPRTPENTAALKEAKHIWRLHQVDLKRHGTGRDDGKTFDTSPDEVYILPQGSPVRLDRNGSYSGRSGGYLSLSNTGLTRNPKYGDKYTLKQHRTLFPSLYSPRNVQSQEDKNLIKKTEIPVSGTGKGQDENNAGQPKGNKVVTNADIPVFSELKGAKGTEWEGKNLRNQPNLKVTRTEPDGRGGTREVTYMTHQPQKGPIPRNRNKLAVTQIPETWARGQGRKLKDVNRDTALALQSQGWDLKGIPKSDLRRLYADFRTGRAVVFEKPDGKYLHYNGKVYHNSNTGEISVGKDNQLRINKPQNRVNPLNIPGPTGDFRVPDQTYA